MKLVTYKKQDKNSIGFLINDSVVDLSAAAEYAASRTGAAAAVSYPSDMVELLEREMLDAAHSLHETFQKQSEWVSEIGVPVAEVELLAPLRKPGKVICIGLNYMDHAKETGKPIPTAPIVFGKYANSIVGPGSAVNIPPVTDKVDYEAELAVVIGKRASRVAADSALGYVAGYMNFNDISARDLQMADGQWMKGKFLDTFAPTGPWLVTKEDIQDPGKLKIELRLNGKTMQSSSTGNLIFSVPTLISFLSGLLTLEPGDIIATGTPSGVGAAMNPPLFLQAGDTVEVEVEGLGVLTNPVTAS
ncbi:MAG: fumarylacetoacetate hydrolase family protein [Dethiobacter sp.]|jgi:acylpyruvate hydrolase|nr:fumarylacetoacetate hydrolase family protein [Dethiobacter sp.]